MNSVRKLVLAGFVLATGAAIAQAAATDPNVIARQALMKIVGGSTKTLGEMAAGKTAFDATAAEAAKAALVAASLDIEARFKTETADPEQEAKPEVWTDWETFLVKTKGLQDAAAAVDVSSAETIGAGMGAIGGACKDCHTTFRL